MQFEVNVSPVSLGKNLLSIGMLLPMAGIIGGVSMAASGAAWWDSPKVSVEAIEGSVLLAGLVVGVAMCLALAVLGRKLWPRDASWAFRGLAAIKPTPSAVWSLSVAAAVCEEIFFRATLVPILGVVGAALVFAAMHWGLYLFAPTKFAALRCGAEIFLIGIVFGIVFDRLGLYAAIAGHVAYNVLAFRVGLDDWTRVHQHWMETANERAIAAKASSRAQVE